MSRPPSQPAPLRRDARRNLELVVSAADRVFAAQGLGATLEDVAAAAGVGVGTVYRRFASKEALIQAVADRKLRTGIELLTEAQRAPSAWEGLVFYLRVGLDLHAKDRGLHEFMHTPELIGERLAEIRAAVAPLMADLIGRAQAEGALRADFAVNDLPLIGLMLSRLAHTHPTLGPRFARRYLELLLKGLAPSQDPAPIPCAPDDDSYTAWCAVLTPTR
ncbi:MAG TPA: TetR family transcriptional regulator [Amycolatopsis sp.]|nr:TetR family transcriptional regulator [Amycolatopsis sp.]